MEFNHPKHVCFKCERCALCCKDTEKRSRKILLLEKEAIRISKRTLKSVKEFAERIEGMEPYIYMMRKDEGRCCFLRDSFCSIYELRPLICRFYPFKLENLGKNKYIFAHTDECPGVGQGLSLQQTFFEDLFSEFLSVMR